MKTRESGMPDEGMWQSFLDPEAMLTALGLDRTVGDAVDFGCGYGTFAIPAACRLRGTCLKLRNSEGSEVCPLSTLQDHYEVVRDSDRVISV